MKRLFAILLVVVLAASALSMGTSAVLKSKYGTYNGESWHATLDASASLVKAEIVTSGAYRCSLTGSAPYVDRDNDIALNVNLTKLAKNGRGHAVASKAIPRHHVLVSATATYRVDGNVVWTHSVN